MNRIRAGMTLGRIWPILVAALLVCLWGCKDAGNPEQREGGAHGSQAEAPRRVVCGSPAVAEVVFALGCGDRVVGVSDYTVYPPEAKAKESIGGWINPNRERLLVLKPDIIVTQGKHETLAAFTREYGIQFQAVKLDTLEDVYTAINSVASVLGVADRGTKLGGEMRGAIRAVREKVARVPPKRVLLLFGRSPGSLTGLGTVGPGTFLDDMIRVAGGTNVFGDATGAYPQVSKESLLVRKPEVILEINPGGLREETVRRLRADWQEFSELPAVRDNRIEYLGDDYLLIPGPRVGQTAERMARAIHPEAFVE